MSKTTLLKQSGMFEATSLHSGFWACSEIYHFPRLCGGHLSTSL